MRRFAVTSRSVRPLAHSLLLLALAGVGCAPAIRNGTEAGLEGSLDALSDQENQQKVAEIATSDEIRESTTALTASVTQGVVQGLKQELAGVDVDKHTKDLMSTVGESTEKMMRENVAPGVAAVVQRSLDASLASASSDRNLERTRRIVSATTDAAVRGMTKALAEGIREDIAPVVKDARGELQPLATQLLADEDFKQAIGGLVHEVSREVVLGSEGAIDTIQQNQDPNQDGSFLGGIGDKLSIGWAVMVALVAALAITFVALVIMVIKGNAQRRHLERDSRQREEMMMAFMQMLAGKSALTPEQRERMEKLGLDPERQAPAASAPEPRRAGPLKPSFNQG